MLTRLLTNIQYHINNVRIQRFIFFHQFHMTYHISISIIYLCVVMFIINDYIVHTFVFSY